MSKPYVFDDECVAGWTEQNIREHFAFDNLRPEARHAYVPIAPFCIVRNIRHGIPGFVTSDMRFGGASLRTRTKRAATRIAKIIEADYYADL